MQCSLHSRRNVYYRICAPWRMNVALEKVIKPIFADSSAFPFSEAFWMMCYLWFNSCSPSPSEQVVNNAVCCLHLVCCLHCVIQHCAASLHSTVGDMQRHQPQLQKQKMKTSPGLTTPPQIQIPELLLPEIPVQDISVRCSIL